MCSNNETSYTLLERAINLEDQDAWLKFHEVYYKFIVYILRDIGIEPADLEDLAQNIYLILMEKLKNYDKSKGKFRSWFRIVIKNNALSHLRKTHRQSQKHANLQSEIEASEEDIFDNAFDKRFELEWKKYLFKIARDRADSSFKGQAGSVFALIADRGMSTSEVAEHLNMKLYTVQTLFNRYKKAVSRELNQLLTDFDHDSPLPVNER